MSDKVGEPIYGWSRDELIAKISSPEADSIEERIHAVKRKFQNTKEGTTPFSVPSASNQLDFVLFITGLVEDSWCKKNLVIVAFTAVEGRMIGIAAKEDAPLWMSPTGMAHLKSAETIVYSLESYANLVVMNYVEVNQKGADLI